MGIIIQTFALHSLGIHLVTKVTSTFITADRVLTS